MDVKLKRKIISCFFTLMCWLHDYVSLKEFNCKRYSSTAKPCRGNKNSGRNMTCAAGFFFFFWGRRFQMSWWSQREIDGRVYGGEEEVTGSEGKRWIMPREAQPSWTQEPFSPLSLKCTENCGFFGFQCTISTVRNNYTSQYVLMI